MQYKMQEQQTTTKLLDVRVSHSLRRLVPAVLRRSNCVHLLRLGGLQVSVTGGGCELLRRIRRRLLLVHVLLGRRGVLHLGCSPGVSGTRERVLLGGCGKAHGAGRGGETALCEGTLELRLGGGGCGACTSWELAGELLQEALAVVLDGGASVAEG